MRLLIAGLAMAIGLAPTLGAQTPDSAAVTIHVADVNGVAVPRARILFALGDSVVRLDQTDAAGRLVRRLPAYGQPYRVSVLSIGFVSTRRLLRLTAGQPSTLDLTLVRVPADTIASLPTVTAEAARRRGPADTLPELERSGFYERRYKGYAPQPSFITAEQMAHWNIVSIADLGSIGRGINPLGCTIYLNGAQIAGIDTSRGGYSWLQVDDLAGVEVYTAFEAPPQYPPASKSKCVALFWMK